MGDRLKDTLKSAWVNEFNNLSDKINEWQDWQAIKTIEKYKPAICVELCENWLNRYENTSEDIYNFLHSLNYKLVDSEGVDKIFIYNEL